MKFGVKRLIRLIAMWVLTFIFFENLKLSGCNVRSPHFIIMGICYMSTIVICIVEGLAVRESEIERLFGKSYTYLYKVYERAKSSAICHEEKLVSLNTEEFDDETDRELLKIVNEYGLTVSNMILDIKED